MTSIAYDGPPDVSSDGPRPSLVLVQVARTTLGLASAELSRVGHQPVALLTRAAQPLLWILVFGAALSGVRGLATDGVAYQVFVVPGVLGQSIVTVALYAGLAIIWERDLGLTQRILVAPGPRAAIIAGKALGAAVRVLVQVALVVAVVAVLGMPVRLSPATLAGVLVVTVAGAMLFACLSLVVASAVRSREQFMGLGQLIILPLFFASNALYPLDLMPGWLQVVAHANPLTYLVGALRRLLLGVGPDRFLMDLAVLVVGAAVLTAVAARTYPRRAL